MIKSQYKEITNLGGLKMSKFSTRELMSELQDKLIMSLETNEVKCPECKGLRFVLVENGDKGYIESCRRCHTGKLYICKHCGKSYNSQCDCKASAEDRHNEFMIQQAEKEHANYTKAEKIAFEDYKGYFIIDEDHVKDKDDIMEWIKERLLDGEDVPDYLWETEPERVFSLDLRDIISDKCENGYEDMYSCLDTESTLLDKAQELIDKWDKEQGNSLNVYFESSRRAVIIKPVVDKIRSEISKC
jgi:hypothetical protein